MANYDVHFFAKPDLMNTERDDVLSYAVQIVKAHGATVYRKGASPLLTLAHPINDQNKAYQLNINFSAEEPQVQSIVKELSAIEDILHVAMVDLDKAYEGRK